MRRERYRLADGCSLGGEKEGKRGKKLCFVIRNGRGGKTRGSKNEKRMSNRILLRSFFDEFKAVVWCGGLGRQCKRQTGKEKQKRKAKKSGFGSTKTGGKALENPAPRLLFNSIEEERTEKRKEKKAI